MDYDQFLTEEQLEQLFEDSRRIANENINSTGTQVAQLMQAVDDGEWAAVMMMADHLALVMQSFSQIAKSQLIYENLKGK